MIASSRTAATSAGVISGSGFAIAKMIGLGAMAATISPVTVPADDTPTNASAPRSASASVRALVSRT